MTLSEIMISVAILAVMALNQFADTGLERASALAVKSANNMMSIATKVSELCGATQRQCTGLSNGVITLPATYMKTIPQDPSATSIVGTGAQYTIQLNTNASDGSKCWSIEGVNSYVHDAVLNYSNADGSMNSPSDTAAAAYLHYDSRAGQVTQSTSNTSPVAGGC